MVVGDGLCRAYTTTKQIVLRFNEMTKRTWCAYLSAGSSGITLLYNSRSINPLWHSHVIWRHASGLTLDQVMTCCLTAPSMNKVDLSSIRSSDIHLKLNSQKYTIQKAWTRLPKISIKYTRANELSAFEVVRKASSNTLLEKSRYTLDWGTFLAIIHILSACTA